MQRHAVAGFVFILAVSVGAARQSHVGRWKNFTAMKSVNSAAYSNGSLWAGTSGGVFVYDVAGGMFTKVTNSEGLSSNDSRAVVMDRFSRIWVGASDGSIDVFDPSSGGWKAIQSIKESNRLQKGIQSFYPKGDSMFVVSGFGVSVFLLNKWEFGDTYANLGFSTQPVVHRALVQNNRVWIATDQGIATALLSAPNLSSPASWSIYNAQGLPSAYVTSMELFHDTLVVGTSNGAAYFSNSSFVALSSLNGKFVNDLKAGGNRMFALWIAGESFRIESLAALNGSTQLVATNDSTSASVLVIDPSTGQPWAGTSSRGIAQWSAGTWKYVFPNGPQSNLFVSLVVDGDGVLWAGTGVNGGGKGFYRYNPALPEGTQWKSFTKAQDPVLKSDDYYKVSLGARGSVWASSWGEGVVEVAGDTIRRKVDVASTPGLSPTLVDPNNPYFVVAGGVAADRQGTNWIVNRTAINGQYLARSVNDSTTTYFRNLYNPGEGLFTNIVIDQSATKWLANSEAPSKTDRGLYYFNETDPVPGTEFTGGWGYLSVSDGLPNNTVISLAVDLDGDVWVGTDLGATIITDPRLPKSRRASVFPLREQSIQTIAVDAVNNKWVGTKEGVFVLSPDGTQLLQQYDVLSTGGQLVDNDVRSIAIDQKRGIVYVGTEKGLSSLAIASVSTERTFSSLEFGPNPYTLPNDEQLTIKNLVANSTIKILTVTGSLISQFKAQGGGRAFWDGRDLDGRFVSSGIYFVVAFSENGNQLTTGKVAVVRK